MEPSPGHDNQQRGDGFTSLLTAEAPFQFERTPGKILVHNNQGLQDVVGGIL